MIFRLWSQSTCRNISSTQWLIIYYLWNFLRLWFPEHQSDCLVHFIFFLCNASNGLKTQFVYLIHRVIGATQNFDEFSKAFSCPQTSYMNPSHKCQVWWSGKLTGKLYFHIFKEKQPVAYYCNLIMLCVLLGYVYSKAPNSDLPV